MPDHADPLGDTTSTADLDASQASAISRTPLHVGEKPGDQIGPYRLLSVLGEGGFGVVYLAERRVPHVQRVALKIIKPGMDSKAVIARFEAERQALAVMDHPNIAKVFDAGATSTGRPYFVMEHVQGEPITAYCDRHNYTIKQRLELFIPVCEAVQHAHMKGIIHRDIKPSNILVMVKDGHAIPKVIDFGVAKAISHTLTDKTIFTEQGQIIGTPEYMSPEQAEMGAIDIDTRTDVYSLGVVLYELLTGLLPFDPKELRSKGYAEIQRIIREVEPPKPSTRLTSVGHTAVAFAKHRQEGIDSLAKTLRRELEWIPLKAMRKDRIQRYATANDMGFDIDNYLHARPLKAGPESLLYLGYKLIRRHSRAALAIATAFFALSIGLAGTSLAMKRAKSAEETAMARGHELEVLSNALGHALPLILEVGIQFHQKGEYGNAEQYLHKALVTALNVYGEDATLTLTLRNSYGNLLMSEGRTAEAEAEFQKVLDGRIRTLGEDTTDTLESMTTLAWVYRWQDKYAHAENLLRAALKGYETQVEPNDSRVLRASSHLGWLLLDQGRAEEAAPYVIAAYNGQLSELGPDHPHTINSMSGMAWLFLDLGKDSEGIELMRDIVDRRRRIWGDDHQLTLGAISNLGESLRKVGALEEALRYNVEAVNVGRIALPAGHWYLGAFLQEYGRTLLALRRFGEAEAALVEAYANHERALGENHRRSRSVRDDIVKLYREWNVSNPEGSFDKKADRWQFPMSQPTEGGAN